MTVARKPLSAILTGPQPSGKPGASAAPVAGSSPVGDTTKHGSPPTPPLSIEDIPVCDSLGVDGVPCHPDATCAPGAVLTQIWVGPTKATEEPTSKYCATAGAAPPTPAKTDQDVLDGAGPLEVALVPQQEQPTLDPSPRTLVNLATILTAGDRELPVSGDATDDGIAVSLAAKPTFHWDFGDGQSLDTDDPGTPYRGQGDPSQTPGDYELHTWTTTGARTVTLTVTWQGTVTRHDTGVTLPLQPLTYTGQAAVDVRASRAVLTGNS